LRNVEDVTIIVVSVVEPIRYKPNNANPLPPQTDGPIVSPTNAEMKGVITTLVCVRKDALAAGLTSRPKVTRPCAPKFQNANSMALFHIGRIIVLPSVPATVLSSERLVDNCFSLDDDDDDARRMGTNANKLSNCRTRLNTLGAGGAHTPRNVPLSVPYRNATRRRIARPCCDDLSFVDNDDFLLSFN
jgi:hypothetical protein